MSRDSDWLGKPPLARLWALERTYSHARACKYCAIASYGARTEHYWRRRAERLLARAKRIEDSLGAKRCTVVL